MTAWLSVILVCALGAMTPGASLIVVLRQAAIGRRNGLATAWAHAAGIGVYAIASVAGVAAVLAAYPAAEQAITLAGALYLGWLGAVLLRSTMASGENNGAAEPSAASPAVAGFVTALLNPKVAAFFLALFSQFVGTRDNWDWLGLLAATAVVVDGLWYSLVAVVGGWVARRRGAERYAGRLEVISGATLMALAGVGLIRAVVES